MCFTERRFLHGVNKRLWKRNLPRLMHPHSICDFKFQMENMVRNNKGRRKGVHLRIELPIAVFRNNGLHVCSVQATVTHYIAKYSKSRVIMMFMSQFSPMFYSRNVRIFNLSYLQYS